MGESPWYIGKMEGDFINNIICIYNFFGESLTRLYYLVKSWWITSTNGESLVKNGESLSSGVRGVGSNEDMVVEIGVEGSKPPRPSMAHDDSWGK